MSQVESKTIAAEDPKPRVVVFMDGGIIQEIISDIAIHVVVIDDDTDGIGKDELSPFDDRDVYVARWTPEISPERTESAFDQVWNQPEPTIDEPSDPATMSADSNQGDR